MVVTDRRVAPSTIAQTGRSSSRRPEHIADRLLLLAQVLDLAGEVRPAATSEGPAYLAPDGAGLAAP
jgi:hypothetical protein